MSGVTPINANFSSSDGTEQYIPPEQSGASSTQAATIECDGYGGYQPRMNWAENAPCGIRDCVEQHEQSHAADWAGRYPDGCRGESPGADVPLGGPGYSEFLKGSECDAYRASTSCLEDRLDDASRDCKDDIQSRLDFEKSKREDYCDEYEC